MSLLFLPLKVLLIALDLLITLVTFGWIKPLKKLLVGETLRTVPVDKDESHRVQPKFKDNLATSPKDPDKFQTVFDLAKDAFIEYSHLKCMGTRTYLGPKSPRIKEFGDISWKTYQQVGDESYKFGAALRSAGLVPALQEASLTKHETPCSIAIFENTCSEWLIAALGAFSQSMIVTTIYATLGMDAVMDAVNDGIIRAIVCNKSNVKVLVNELKSMPTLKVIIYTNDMVAPHDDTIQLPTKVPKGVKIVSFEEFVESGSTTAFPPTPPKPNTCAVIMYTSGSTGRPKGVVVTHRNIVGTMASFEIMLKLENGKDVYLAYLPLAHIFELIVEFTALAKAFTLCYADPRTLTTKGAYPMGALEQYRPTIMIGVPKIWDVIKKGIETKVGKASPLSQFLVKTAFEARTFALRHGYDTPLFNALVFKKFTKAVGGRLRYAASGGGALNPEVQEFCRTCFGVPVCQGYGLTETCAGLTLQDKEDIRGEIAGVPVPSVEIKLTSCPDILDKAGQPYLAKDRFDVDGNPIFGRGEIMGRGTNIALGYYMMPEKTKEVFEEDGFFATGDIGQFMSDGSISIIDRKKNLLKLKGGEYIALEKMEAVYGNSSFVDAVGGGICCYGDSEMDRPVALMQLNKETVLKWAKDNGVDGDFESLVESKELMDAVLADMKKEHGKSSLSHIEKLVGLSFLTNPWTPDNGCLTAANKLQRRAVISTHEKEFVEVKKKGMF